MSPSTSNSASASSSPHGLEALTELAMNLRWSCNHSADELWRRLDPALWERTRHPSVVFQTVAREKLTAALANPDFCRLLDQLVQAQRHGDDPGWDATEAEALYLLLEREVIPEFYARNDQGIPAAWVMRMRESMARLTPTYAASRAVTEYTEEHYLPAAAAYRQRAADKGGLGHAIVGWRQRLEQQWPRLSIGQLEIEQNGEQYEIEVEINLSDLDANAVEIEVYANGINGGNPVRQQMTRVRNLGGSGRGGVYRATVSSARPAGDYTPRVIPHFEGLSTPLEAGQILWQR